MTMSYKDCVKNTFSEKNIYQYLKKVEKIKRLRCKYVFLKDKE